MRKRLTYANVTATLALFLAMSGGAMAASHYLINSTKQINPKVLKKLKGNTGPKGAAGATGATGAAGKEGTAGKEGPAGPFPATLPSGKTLTGAWIISGTSNTLASTGVISFQYPLASRPIVHIIAQGASAPAGCSGNAEHPGAAPGNLCIFEGYLDNIEPGETGDYDPSTSGGVNDRAAFAGIVVYARSKTEGTHFEDGGTYAVTGA